MTDKLTLEQAEAAYLLLVARRILHFQREAAERGEEYHDMQSDIILNCGCSARLRFCSVPGTYEPRLWLMGSFTKPEDYATVAKGILGGDVENIPSADPKEHVFRRKKTA